MSAAVDAQCGLVHVFLLDFDRLILSHNYTAGTSRGTHQRRGSVAVPSLRAGLNPWRGRFERPTSGAEFDMSRFSLCSRGRGVKISTSGGAGSFDQHGYLLVVVVLSSSLSSKSAFALLAVRSCDDPGR